MSPPDLIKRFTRAERTVHHVTALLMLVCLVTAACLYVPAISALVGRRALIKPIHIWAGFALPVPILLGLLSRAFRGDLRTLNRFGPHDREWLRRRDRRAVLHGRGVIPVGKFNAGQKLNAAFVAGSILVMLGTGAMLTFPDPWPDDWRTGATFVHDWLTIAIFVVVAGHLTYALSDRGSLTGMLTGRVDRDWAARHHAGWLDRIEAGEQDRIDAGEIEPDRRHRAAAERRRIPDATPDSTSHSTSDSTSGSTSGSTPDSTLGATADDTGGQDGDPGGPAEIAGTGPESGAKS